MNRHALADAEWASVHEMLKQIPGIWKSREAELRRFVDAVLWICRTGTAWDDLPSMFGVADVVRQRYRRWARLGVWQCLFEALRMSSAADGLVLVDATICKAHRSSSGVRGGGDESIGASRGGTTSKIHAATDVDGHPLRLVLTDGQRSDCTQFDELTDGLEMAAAVADRGYDTNAIRARCAERGILCVVPTRKNRKVQIQHDRALYARRHAV